MPAKQIHIYDIWVPATPQHGSWNAGVTVKSVEDPTQRASWHGGDRQYEGREARLFLSADGKRKESGLFLVVPPGSVEVFLAIDDDPQKAGTEQAADQVRFTFFPEPKAGGNTFAYEAGAWKVWVEYGLTDPPRT